MRADFTPSPYQRVGFNIRGVGKGLAKMGTPVQIGKAPTDPSEQDRRRTRHAPAHRPRVVAPVHPARDHGRREAYRLFDRRCRTETTLAKLARLRQQVQRFTKVGQTLRALFTGNVEKALTFLDDRLLPATSNAVERGNRRHRKMQTRTRVYRVRTRAHVADRIALDLLREAQAAARGLIIG
jgi:hypothetical protein